MRSWNFSKMLDRLTALCAVFFFLFAPVACTQSQSRATTVPVASAALVDHEAHRAEHENCGVFCQDACHDVSADECAYDDQESCVAECVPSCEEGDVRTEVEQCQTAAQGLFQKK